MKGDHSCVMSARSIRLLAGGYFVSQQNQKSDFVSEQSKLRSALVRSSDTAARGYCGAQVISSSQKVATFIRASTTVFGLGSGPILCLSVGVKIKVSSIAQRN